MATRIMAIDDDDSILTLYRVLLEDEGYEVVAFKEASHRLQEVERLAPALIILDLKLSIPDQSHLFLQMMCDSKMSIPILVCSADIREIRASKGYFEQEHIPVLQKPFDVEELFNAIETLLHTPKNGQNNRTQ